MWPYIRRVVVMYRSTIGRAHTLLLLFAFGCATEFSNGIDVVQPYPDRACVFRGRRRCPGALWRLFPLTDSVVGFFSRPSQFLRQELKYENGYEKRQRAFHRDDTHISVRELWEQWMRSEVYNWTKDQTIDWLVHVVQLPQYANTFGHLNIDGSKLPRYVIKFSEFICEIDLKGFRCGHTQPLIRFSCMIFSMKIFGFVPVHEALNWCVIWIFWVQ